MNNLGILLFSLFAFMTFTSCETEAEKAARIRQQEADKIIVTEDEFNTLKEYAKSGSGTIKIGEAKVVSGDNVEGNKACEPLTLDDLLELYNIGKKRDWLVEHDFEVNYCFAIQQKRKTEYDDMRPSMYIGYGRCHYADAARKRRVGLRLTHVKNQQVDYETTFKDNFEKIVSDLVSKGAEGSPVKAVSWNKNNMEGNYEYQGIPIELSYDIRKDPIIYKIEFKSTATANPMNNMSAKDRKEFEEMLENPPK